MKRKILLIAVLVLAVLFQISCKRTRYATVTIFNDGEILITASVDGDTELIGPGEGVEWTLSWEGGKSITVYLYAEPVGFNDYDEDWATLFNGDDYEWYPGWVYVAGSLTKKKN
ncbi:MAG: hypothetical protein KAW12_30905 [Candidatus Aminicenantes bacterium]|nr:hypothetical protein [Candidatus Aminicenantes bacterium]